MYGKGKSKPLVLVDVYLLPCLTAHIHVLTCDSVL